MDGKGKALMLVGSVPYDTVEEVFEVFGGGLGAYLAAIPDGEVGSRKHWISKVHYQVIAAHPEFEVLRRPRSENGLERLNPREPGDSWLFRVKEGIERVRFGNPGWRLGYSHDAISSYFTFKTLREKGLFAADTRFQVSIPSVNSAIAPRVFPKPGDLEKIRPGYEDAVVAEVDMIFQKVPSDDLAIQWDCATELQDAYGGITGLDPTTVIERNIGQFKRLCSVIPEAALLGFHLCFGTLGGWPRFAPDDLTGAVKMANAFVKHSVRRVDWLHLPVLDRSDEHFFSPLSYLKSGDARVYLGMIHNMEGFQQRLTTARKFLPEFGLAAYCGLGREDPAKLSMFLEDHLKAAKAAGF